MRNLEAEMKRYGITKTDIKDLLSCSDKTVRNKIDENSEFSVNEALKIRDTFFPSMRISYLFARADEQRDVPA